MEKESEVLGEDTLFFFLYLRMIFVI